jgi:hypothetical protein
MAQADKPHLTRPPPLLGAREQRLGISRPSAPATLWIHEFTQQILLRLVSSKPL